MRRYSVHVVNALLCSTLLVFNFFHHNVYPIFSIEALILIFPITVFIFFGFALFEKLKLVWVAYGLFIALFVEIHFNIVTPFYIFLKEGIGRSGIYLGLVSYFSVFFLLSYVLRTHITRIVGVGLTTMFVTTSVLFAFGEKPQLFHVLEQPRSERLDKPNILFLILDEHIGVEGLPEFDEEFRNLNPA